MFPKYSVLHTLLNITKPILLRKFILLHLYSQVISRILNKLIANGVKSETISNFVTLRLPVPK